MAYKIFTKKIPCFLLAVVLLFCVTASTYVSNTVKADSLSANQNKQSELQRRNSELNDTLSGIKNSVTEQTEYKQELDKKMENIQSQIDNINAQIVELDNKIATKQSEIEETQVKIDKNMNLLKQRLKAIYMAGETSTLDIILGAKDFNDFLDKAEIIKNVSSHDSKLIDELKNDMQGIKEEKESIEEDKKTVAYQKNELESKRVELTNLVEESNKILESLGEETQKVTDQLDQNSAEMQRINAEIEAYYRSQNQSQSGGQSAGMVGTGNYMWPVPGFTWISSDYYDTDSRNSMHGAIDIAGVGIYGAKVVAADSGTVIQGSVGGWGGGYGTYLVIDHGNGKSTLYAHMSGAAVSIGQTVSKGQTIGFVGSTGHSTGPHLHFETRLYGSKYNPMNEF